MSKQSGKCHGHIKKHHINLTQVYAILGCSKTDLSRWEYNPCSTHGSCKASKISVCQKAADLFQLTEKECESLANKAGLSLCVHKNGLLEAYQIYRLQRAKLPPGSTVSERMFQYYITGKEPTKQALLAIAISLGLEFSQIDGILHAYGYCLSKSLPNDAVVSWHLQNREKTRQQISSRQHIKYRYDAPLLYAINEELADLELPLLMTKPMKR